MQLQFNKSVVNILFNNNPVAVTVKKMYSHLQYLPINFKPWDNPYTVVANRDRIIDNLVEFGQRVGVTVDRNRTLAGDQDYFNLIHKIYEQSYDGNPQWLDFHEHIHMCESQDKKNFAVSIDYREKAGLLEKKFDPSWADTIVTSIARGDVYVSWAELGKTPYVYWKNSEPNDLARLCELAKPWLKLRAKITIALEDFDFVNHEDQDEFCQWWKNYETAWCQHWGIDHWGIREIAGVTVIGQVDNVELLDFNLSQNIHPQRLQL